MPQKIVAQEKFNGIGGLEYNKPHTDFTSRNSRWIFNEMQNIPQTITCEDQCISSGIVGTSEICSNGNYSMNLPTGSNVIWSISPNSNSFVSLSTSGTTATLTQLPVTAQQNGNSGEVTLTANYTSPNCGNGTVSKTVFVGSRLPTYSIYAPNGYCSGSSFEAIAAPYSYNGGTVSYNWYVNGVLNSYHGYKLRGYFPAGANNYIGVQTVQTCGTSQEYYQLWNCLIAPINIEQFTISPIPSNSNITVTSIGKFNFNAIKIVDKMGNIKKQWQLPNNSTTSNLNIADLNMNIYYIQVFDGTKWVGKLISVQ